MYTWNTAIHQAEKEECKVRTHHGLHSKFTGQPVKCKYLSAQNKPIVKLTVYFSGRRDLRIVPSTRKNERRKRGRKEEPYVLKKKNKHDDRNRNGVVALKI